MVATPSKNITLQKFLALPETKPASEYINGKIIQKPMPQGEHSVIQGELIIALNGSLKSQKIARAFPELRCTFGGRSTVPDVTVFTWDRIPRKDNGGIANIFQIAPDWTIEILSPDQSHTRVTRNILHCLDNGTQLGWLIDPSEQSIFAYYPNQQPEFFEDANDVLPVPDFAKSFKLTLGELFGWLLE
ncbi:MAG: Uma2 family endonuclease [Cyanobacteria bacterium J06588_4]